VRAFALNPPFSFDQGADETVGAALAALNEELERARSEGKPPSGPAAGTAAAPGTQQLTLDH
jgi:hypothetical protein